MSFWFITILFLLGLPIANAYTWQQIAPGIEYQDIGATFLTPWAHIHVFRISLKENRLELFTASNLAKRNAPIDALARKSNALVAINGGFFDQQYHPLGLRISQKQRFNPIKHISWWGVFFIKDNLPHIASTSRYPSDAQVEFAIQSGPRLIVNGHIPHLKPGIAERTAIGITKKNQIILLVTDNAMLTTTELATLMRAQPLNCKNALNLDGGSSSQLFAKTGNFHLNVHGLAYISDALIVKNNIRETH